MKDRPILDRAAMEGRRCDACRHYSVVKMRLRGPVELERCDLHERACTVARAKDTMCGPRATNWGRK